MQVDALFEGSVPLLDDENQTISDINVLERFGCLMQIKCQSHLQISM